MKRTNLATPTVHPNGTGRETLLADYRVCLSLIKDAAQALSRCAPNQRDYYVRGDDVWYQACKEHAARIQHLQTVHDELTTLARSVLRQTLTAEGRE